MNKAMILVGFLFLNSPLPAQANDELTVTWVSGAPKIVSGAMRATSVAAVGQRLSLPVDIDSGDQDQAILKLGDSTIHVAPNSAIHIPAAESSTVQRAIQTLGSAMFNIAPKDKERFQVDTPYLVAVVKGTLFNIIVDEDKSVIVLQSGELHVSPFEASQSFDMRAGDVLSVDWLGNVERMRLDQLEPDAPAPEVVLDDTDPAAGTDLLSDEIDVLLSFFQNSAAGGREQF